MKKDYQNMSILGLCTYSLKNLEVATLLANVLTKYYHYYWTTIFFSGSWHVTNIFSTRNIND